MERHVVPPQLLHETTNVYRRTDTGDLTSKDSLRAEYDGRYDLQALLHYEQANELNLKVEL